MKQTSQAVAYDPRRYLTETERIEWDALTSEAETLDRRRRDISKRLDGMRTRVWNRRRTDLRRQSAVPCPRCLEGRPWSHPTALQPGQICRVDRYQDPRSPLDSAATELAT